MFGPCFRGVCNADANNEHTAKSGAQAHRFAETVMREAVSSYGNKQRLSSGHGSGSTFSTLHADVNAAATISHPPSRKSSEAQEGNDAAALMDEAQKEPLWKRSANPRNESPARTANGAARSARLVRSDMPTTGSDGSAAESGGEEENAFVAAAVADRNKTSQTHSEERGKAGIGASFLPCRLSGMLYGRGWLRGRNPTRPAGGRPSWERSGVAIKILLAPRSTEEFMCKSILELQRMVKYHVDLGLPCETICLKEMVWEPTRHYPVDSIVAVQAGEVYVVDEEKAKEEITEERDILTISEILFTDSSEGDKKRVYTGYFKRLPNINYASEGQPATDLAVVYVGSYRIFYATRDIPASAANRRLLTHRTQGTQKHSVFCNPRRRVLQTYWTERLTVPQVTHCPAAAMQSSKFYSILMANTTDLEIFIRASNHETPQHTAAHVIPLKQLLNLLTLCRAPSVTDSSQLAEIQQELHSIIPCIAGNDLLNALWNFLQAHYQEPNRVLELDSLFNTE